ncbi:MAG: zinc ribbon domain-containing protein [Candidatus Thorarchaeota archaeon]
MGKSIALLGNKGTGKTTFLVASIHRLSEMGWIEANLDKLPDDYGLWIDLMVSGKPLPPTVKEYAYPLEFKKRISFKGSIVKLGWLFSGMTLRVGDMRGEDYTRTTPKFKRAVENVSAVLVTIDPSDSGVLGDALSGQIQPLIDGIRYMIQERGKDLEYLGFVITKRSKHNHTIEEVRHYIEMALRPILSYLKENNTVFRVLEVDSRGSENRLAPWGIEYVYYDMLATLCKVEGRRLDVTQDDAYLWIESSPVIGNGEANSSEPLFSYLTESQSGPEKATSSTQENSQEAEVGIAYLVICPHCGHKNRHGLSKCKNCGASL